MPLGSCDWPEGGKRGGNERDERREGGRERQMKPLDVSELHC